jgi:hypothetical protein
MVSKNQAIMSSIISAAIIVAAHYFAHKYVHMLTTLQALQIMYVGIAVGITAFLVIYIGKVGLRRIM